MTFRAKTPRKCEECGTDFMPTSPTQRRCLPHRTNSNTARTERRRAVRVERQGIILTPAEKAAGRLTKTAASGLLRQMPDAAPLPGYSSDDLYGREKGVSRGFTFGGSMGHGAPAIPEARSGRTKAGLITGTKGTAETNAWLNIAAVAGRDVAGRLYQQKKGAGKHGAWSSARIRNVKVEYEKRKRDDGPAAADMWLASIA